MMNKRSITMISLPLLMIMIVFLYLTTGKKEYNTLSDLEKLFEKREVNYTTRPMVEDHTYPVAKEQLIVDIKGNDIFVYIVDDEFDFNQTVMDLANSAFEDEHVVSPVHHFIFVHFKTNMEQYYEELFGVIEEIRKASH